MTIHSTAIVAPEQLLLKVRKLALMQLLAVKCNHWRGCEIGSHVVIEGETVIGENCQIFSGASLGQAPQSISYKGEPSGYQSAIM